ncbi:hypothetical protein BC831DRAFT_470413 [Entophlyctis helioformis]|nr:hypothetical protein BC831DRAFT_470413 [Entophlyctis helioformis]
MANPPIQPTHQPPSHTRPILSSATFTPRSDCPMLLMPTSCSPTKATRLFTLSVLTGAKGTCLVRPAC